MPDLPDTIVYKPAGIAETFRLSYLRIIAESWGPNRRYVAGDIVRPPTGNGFVYVASLTSPDTFGLSSSLTPDFKPGHDETTEDGAIVWTASRPGAASLEAITASVWALDAGIVEDSELIAGFETQITVSGGVAGEQYRMTNTITRTSGEEEIGSLVLEITDPVAV